MKKKLIGMILMLTVACSMVACTKKTGESAEQQTETQEVIIDSCVSLMENVWANYDEEQKFSTMGGDYETMVEGAPGAIVVTDDPETEEDETAAVKQLLLVPASQVEKLSSGASMSHMMNANTFSAGAFELKNAEDMESFADAYMDNILGNQWLCGFPDKAVIVKITDTYCIAMFGKDEFIKSYQNAIMLVYPGAKVIREEAIVL